MHERFVRYLTVGGALVLAMTIGAAASGPPAWTQTTPATASERRGAAIAHDDATGQLLLFGGDNSVNTLNDTWVFDGARWSLLHTAHAPMSRTNASMVYDPVTRTVILYGGDPHFVHDGISYLGDTWSFDGRDWTELHPVHTPGTRAEAAATWDGAGSRMVVFGGYTDASGPAQDTWTFDGVDWAPQSPQHVPPVRHGAMMAYADAVRGVVMFGGLGNPPAGSTSPYLPDTWTWSGGDWSLISAGTTATPQGRFAGVMAPIGGGAVMLFRGYWDSGVGGGATPGTHVTGPSSTLSDVWTYASGGWTKLTATGPAGRFQAAAAWDPSLGAAVMYGGCCNSAGGFFTDTWSFDGTAWTAHERGDAPSVREGAVAVSDTDRGDVVLFGGFGGAGFLGDTWIESAGQWHAVATGSAAPVGRFAASMAYDGQRGTAVLFAGQAQSANQCSNTVDQLDVNHLCNDTWTFNGSTWTRSATGSAKPPPYRSLASMAFDGANGQTVMFGGFADQGELGDTWTFDGTTWTQQHPAASPPARDGAALVYDPALQRLVLFGGEGTAADGSIVYFADTWTWDGTTWLQLHPAVSPPGLYEVGATWAADLGGVLVAGGQSYHGSGVFNTVNDAWLFDGTTWTRQAVAAAPGERYFAPLAWDAASHTAVIFGGLGNLGLSDDAWMLTTQPAPVVAEFPMAALAIAVGAGAMLALRRRRDHALALGPLSRSHRG
ncbi:MAG TPA: hypothetical protein VN193_14555 [Candidatus Angelobacter sp.]|jgi:hypothetical protein|nr:hypothetical protein [Candidatus Angelobacter sp.]